MKKKLTSRTSKSDVPQGALEFVENLKRQWMSTVDALIDPLMIVDRRYNIQKANLSLAQNSTGKSGSARTKSVKSIIGKKCYQVFAGRSKPCVDCKMKEVAADGKARRFELEQVNGHNYYEVASQPMFDLNKNVEGVVLIYHDRTEAKTLQNQLVQNEKLASIGLLAGGVAHEINNPLGGILIFSQMLLRELPKDGQPYNDAKEIEIAALRCKDIVENLLAFARAQPPAAVSSGKVKNSKISEKHHRAQGIERTDVIAAVRQALHFVQIGNRQHQVEFIDKLGNRAIEVFANRNKLIQVFLNLLQNALQAMPKGGEIKMRALMTKSSNHSVQIEIEDSGSGIKKEHLKNVFDPFFTTKETGKGTGLGLAICYGIIKDMDGDIQISSKYRQGTKVHVILPVAG